MKLLLVVFVSLFLLLVLGLFLLAPSGRKVDAPLLFAHRGLHGLDPENSLAAFQKAKDAGYAVELDVHLSKDGVLVVFHDDDLLRMTGKRGQVEKTSWQTLQTLVLSESAEHIPSLSQVLDLIEGKVPILVEIKHPNDTRRKELCRAVDEHMKQYAAATGGGYLIESFDPFILAWFRKNSPSTCRGILSGGIPSLKKGLLGRVEAFLLNHLWLNFVARPDLIAYSLSHRQALGFRLCRRIFHPTVLFWTVRNDKDAQTVAKTGAYGYIFEHMRPMT